MAQTVGEVSKVTNKPGVYKHKDSGSTLTVKSHPKFGSAQADGLVRAGFVFVGPAPKKTEKVPEATKEKVAAKAKS